MNPKQPDEQHEDQRADEHKYTDWANEPTVAQLRADYLNASPDRDLQIQKIDKWLDNLHGTGSAARKKVKGRSNIRPKLIRKQAEWRYASLSEPFLDNPDIFEVNPVTYEDREAAIQNGLILNNQFNTAIDKNQLIDEYVRTAVDEGTAILRVGWCYQEREMEVPVFEAVPTTDPSVVQHTELIKQNLAQDPNFLATLNPEVQDAFKMHMQTGLYYGLRKNGTRSELQVTANHPTIEVVNYNNITLDPTAEGKMEKANFAIYSFESSLAELKKETDRYFNLDQIDVTDSTPLGEPDHNPDNESTFQFEDKNRKKFVVYEYWGMWDINDNGILEPIVASYVGDTMIRLEESPYPFKELPFVAVPYLPVRRSMYGEPDGELLEENQEVIGALTRGMIDIMARSANGQMGRRKDALDPVNRLRFEAGKDYEFNPNVRPDEAFYMHTWKEIPRSAEYLMNAQNTEAEALTGVRAFGQGSDGNIGDKPVAAIRSASDAASQRELGILRRLGEGFKKVGRKIIAMNAVFLDEEEVVRVTNDEFVPIRRDDLKGNFDLRLAISTAESDNAKASELSFMMQTTSQSMGPEFTQLIMSDIARLRKMPALAKKIETFQPQPDPLAQRRSELEVQLLEAQIANEYAKAHENQQNGELDKAKARQIHSQADQQDLDFVEQEGGIKQDRELELRRAQGQENMRLAVFNAKIEELREARKPKADK